MKRLLSTILMLPALIMLMLLSGSCSGSVAADRIGSAREAVARRDYVDAAAICDDITASSDTLSATDLCALSVIYMNIAEGTADDGHIASAASCYAAALDRDSVVTAAYFDSVQLADAAHLMLLDQIVTSLNSPRDIPADTLYIIE
ncbi:MAG: hypothetical protein NC117_00950 [Pseudoflavonifractor sp.]|nr:hypothetical protein [Pseudoflavonifractor sp.]